jgi:hypothetical protein
MTQALYAHMNNKVKKKLSDDSSKQRLCAYLLPNKITSFDVLKQGGLLFLP